MESIDTFIDQLPKAELHLHLVGSASVPTVLELARRHAPDAGGPGALVPRSEAELAAFFGFRDFPHFADVYGAVSALVREPADVAELVTGAARDLAGQNVRYAGRTCPGTYQRSRRHRGLRLDAGPAGYHGGADLSTPGRVGGACGDIQEGQRIPRSSLGPGRLRRGWSGGKMGLYAIGRAGR